MNDDLTSAIFIAFSGLFSLVALQGKLGNQRIPFILAGLIILPIKQGDPTGSSLSEGYVCLTKRFYS